MSQSNPPTPPATHIKTLPGYDLWSADYDAIDNPLIAMVDRALDLYPEPVAGKTILELGCGTARLAPRFLAGGAAQYTGVDGSAGMLARARQQHPSNPRIQLIQADLITPLPLPAHGFDILIISLVLEHFAVITPILQNAAQLLAADGTLRILELHPDRHRAGSGAHFLHNGQDIRLPSYPHDIAEFQRELAAANLSPQQIIEHTPDEKTLARSVKAAKYKDLPFLLDIRAAKS